MKKVMKNWLTAMLMVICFMLALAAPDIVALKAPAPAMVGYLASFGVLCFGLRFFILMGRE